MPGTALVSRRHVDLLRTASAQCRPGPADPRP
ncbi:putative leader peptide [Modestobacter versicolor]